MLKTLAKIGSIGVISEPAPEADDALRVARAPAGARFARCSAARSAFAKSTRARATAASSRSTRSTTRSTTSKGYGIKFVASPRHADLLLVTGPVARNMELALRRTYDATPDPKLVVAIGDCGCTGGIFGESYASAGRVANVHSGRRRRAGLPAAPKSNSRRYPDRVRAGPLRRRAIVPRCVAGPP